MRSRRNVAAGIAFALAVLAAPGAAAQDHVPWIVLESRGQVTQAAADGAALPVKPGAMLAEGAPVMTGADGALVVAHGNDRVTVSANSAFSIPARAEAATGPSILQTLGTLLFKVEHTPGRRFEVETPYLAAVVKGTVFTVGVDSATQVVHVAQGAVEVTALGSHDAALVRPGQTATLSLPTGVLSVIGSHHSSVVPGNGPATASLVRAATASDPSGAMPRPAAPPPSDRAPHITRTLGDAPLDISAVTNGLVKASVPTSASTPASPDPGSAASVTPTTSTSIVSVGAVGPIDAPVPSPVTAAPAVSVGTTTPSVTVTTPVVPAVIGGITKTPKLPKTKSKP